MVGKDRNSYSDQGWELLKVNDYDRLKEFDCGNEDLNDFFRNDALAHKTELLCETYFVREATVKDEFPVALISLCNDAVRHENVWWWLSLHATKKYPSYPAVKIARFGVGSRFQRRNIGTHVINMIKKLFLTDNRTGCRLVTVDAYNDPEVLDFYLKNEFQFFSDKDKSKKQRSLFFDLKRLQI